MKPMYWITGVLLITATLGIQARADESVYTYYSSPGDGVGGLLLYEYKYSCNDNGTATMVKDHLGWGTNAKSTGIKPLLDAECAKMAKNSEPPPPPLPEKEYPQEGLAAQEPMASFYADILMNQLKNWENALKKTLTPDPAEHPVSCRNFASCSSLARAYSAKARAKMEENRDLYKTDYARAKANEAEIMKLDSKANQAMIKARSCVN